MQQVRLVVAVAWPRRCGETPPNPHNEFYLKTRAEKSGHLIDLRGKERPLEQSDRPVAERMTPERIAALEHG